MTNKDNSNNNNPNNIASNHDSAAVSQSNASAIVKLDDFASARPDLKSADTRPEPATDQGPAEKPATDEGGSASPFSKKSGNLNALRHGGYFHGILPWELTEDFQALHESFREYWRPHGAPEEEAVLTLSQWTWTRRRVIQGGIISYLRSPVAKGLKSGENTWDDIVRHQAKVPEYIQSHISSMSGLVDALTRLGNTIGDHYYWTNTDEGKDIQMALVRMRMDIGLLESSVREMVTDGYKTKERMIEKITNLFDHAYQPDEIEKQVRLLSTIDREIDKAGKRLIYLKTFKGIEAEAEARKAAARMPALIDSPSMIPDDNLTLKEAEVNESTEVRGTRALIGTLEGMQLPNRAKLESPRLTSLLHKRRRVIRRCFNRRKVSAVKERSDPIGTLQGKESMKLFSRRSALFSAAMIPAVVVSRPALTGEADTALLALGHRFDAIAAQMDYAIEHASDIDWDTLYEFGRVHDEIVAARATTMEGLCVESAGRMLGKARRFGCWRNVQQRTAWPCR